ncbi:hypothetical protein [Peribacillus acanthi]|uniref:hypothetical protein n=1 Tax=Peribacillus acanthi TaxID=2171554 RepID=UPI000D3EAAD3|nr:hypothetical protein [Peribacillus acanthi]
MLKKLVIAIVISMLCLTVVGPPALGATKTPTVAQLQKKVAELTKQIKNLTTSINQRTKEKASLQSQIKSKDGTIQKQQKEIQRLKEIMANKDDLIEEKEALILEQELKMKNLETLSRAEVLFTDANGNTVSQDTSGAIKWYGFKTDYTVIYLTQHAFDKFHFILDLSDTIMEDIAPYFGVKKLPQQVPVFISFDEPVTKTKSGEYFAREKRIFIKGDFFRPYSTRVEENFIGVYVHEFAHAFQDVALDLNPIRDKNRSNMMWLNEGMACFVGHQFIDYAKYNLEQDQITMRYQYDKDVYKEQIMGDLRATNSNIQTINSLPNEHVYAGSAIYESMIFYIEEKYGHKLFFEFIESLRSQSVPEALQKHFGVTEAQFIEDWKIFFDL